MQSILDYILQNVTTDMQKRGVNYFIKSPFTNEKTASFCIFVATNSFFDYSADFGGDVVVLHMKLNNLTKKEAYIEMITGNISNSGFVSLLPPKVHKAPEVSTFNVDEIYPIENDHLIHYFWHERGIHPEILQEHCLEMRYTVKGYTNKAVCFMNNTGGFEIRNDKFKGGIGSKDVTFIKGVGKNHDKNLNIFEGFSDFLAYLTLSKKLNNTYDTYVLNSVVFKNRIEVKSNVQQIRLFVDNDKSGQKAVDYYINLYGKGMIWDARERYSQYNDVNEMLIDKIKYQ